MTDRDVIRAAAKLLDEDAAALFQSHTVGRKWIINEPADETARAGYKERRQIAQRLRRIAKDCPT